MTELVRGEHAVNTATGQQVLLGPLAPNELPVLHSIFADIVATKQGYPHAPPLSAQDFESTWVSAPTMVVVARVDGEVNGAYYLKPNFAGRAAHIANAGYLVSGTSRRRGIGRLLVEDSLWRAPLLGFDAIMFNLVFASNPARPLYENLGFAEIGRIPDAVEGEDAIIYWRKVG